MGQTLARDPSWNWGAAHPPGVAGEQEVLRGLLTRLWDPAVGVLTSLCAFQLEASFLGWYCGKTEGGTI